MPEPYILDMSAIREASERMELRAAKEIYLDGIVSRISELKMDGKPLSNEYLLGDSLQQGTEMFGLQEFSPQVQTDIILSLAYFRTPDFENRVAQSLGYDSPEKITGDDENVYNDIVRRGREAYDDIKFEVIDDLKDSHNEANTEYKSTVHIPKDGKGQSAAFGFMNVTAHEIAHHIYNSFGEGAVNPGIYHQGEGEKMEESEHYGNEGSPYDQINESDINRDKAKEVYGNFAKSHAKDLVDTGQVAKEEYDEYISKLSNMSPEKQVEYEEQINQALMHDNTGYERAADVHGARMTMLREGIWNPFGNEPLTEKHIEQLRQRHPEYRIFEYWNNQEATQYINTIAQNDNVQPSVDRESLLEELRQQVKENVKNTLAEIPKAGTDTQSLNVEQSADITKSFEKDNLTNEMAILASTKFDIAYESMEAEQQQQQQQHSFGMHV